MEDIVIFTEHLKKKYPNYSKYRMYHKLISSTVPKSMYGIIEGDFPGEYSIEKFIEHLREKYIKH